MPARILVVDDLLPNVKLLEAKLAREYFDVLTAMNGAEALEIAKREKPDIVLLDVMMPEMDGFEVCRRLKADSDTTHIPVVMVTALNDSSDRVQGLEAGADDFLTKPINDVALLARVRSLVRLKLMVDELRLRERTGENFGAIVGDTIEDSGADGNVLVIEDRDIYAANIERALGSEHAVTIEKTAGKVVEGLRGVGVDLVIVSLGLRDIDGLRLCSQIRSTEECRHTPLLILVEDTPDEMERLVKGLELGVNDYLIRPIDANELQARVRTQVKRKRYQDRLRANYEKSVELAVTDTLTGVYNRNYLETHLDNMVQRAVTNDRSMALALMDIDFFKRINDQHGHNAGDAVLREFAGRIQRGIRGIDLVARLGGEEFVVLMPDTDIDDAHVVAERLREGMESRPFLEDVMNGGLSVTVSIGVAPSLSGSDRATALLERADAALYEAKRGGRNKVILAADVTMAAVAQGS